jgi:hypothetical protein
LGVGRGLGVAMGRALGVGLGEAVAVGVPVAVAVAVGVGEGGVGVGVHDEGSPWHPKTWTVSTRQPSLEPLVSLAIRQRNLTSRPPGLSSTTVVMKPPESPLQARRPAIGLPRSVLIVRL